MHQSNGDELIYYLPGSDEACAAMPLAEMVGNKKTMRFECFKSGLLVLTCAALLAACSSSPSHDAAAGRGSQPATEASAPSSRTQPAATKAAAEKFNEAINDDLNVYFASASSEIANGEKDKLREHAQRLKAEADLLVTLIGYADDSGSRSYNVAITDMRVSAVSKQLRSFGVAARQIRRNVSGHRQTSSCKTPACQQKLRRVELVYGTR